MSFNMAFEKWRAFVSAALCFIMNVLNMYPQSKCIFVYIFHRHKWLLTQSKLIWKTNQEEAGNNRRRWHQNDNLQIHFNQFIFGHLPPTAAVKWWHFVKPWQHTWCFQHDPLKQDVDRPGWPEHTSVYDWSCYILQLDQLEYLCTKTKYLVISYSPFLSCLQITSIS